MLAITLHREKEISHIVGSNVTARKNIYSIQNGIISSYKFERLSIVNANINWSFLVKQSSISAMWVATDSETVLTKLGGMAMLMSDGKPDNCNWV